MKTKLTLDQEEQINNLILETILPALQEDVCIPDMSDIKEDSDVYDEVWCERIEILMNQAVAYLKNNLH